MKEQDRHEYVLLPESQRSLATILYNEVGPLLKHSFSFIGDDVCPSRDGFPDAINHVRTKIRDAVLAERVQRITRRQLCEAGEGGTAFLRHKDVIGANDQNGVVYKGKLDECPDVAVVNELLVKPQYRSYAWQQVTYWRLGIFDELLKKTTKSKYLLLKKAGVLLFSDELVQLQKGKVITPYHWGGVFGMLFEELDTFAVRDQELYRVRANLSD